MCCFCFFFSSFSEEGKNPTNFVCESLLAGGTGLRSVWQAGWHIPASQGRCCAAGGSDSAHPPATAPSLAACLAAGILAPTGSAGAPGATWNTAWRKTTVPLKQPWLGTGDHFGDVSCPSLRGEAVPASSLATGLLQHRCAQAGSEMPGCSRRRSGSPCQPGSPRSAALVPLDPAEGWEAGTPSSSAAGGTCSAPLLPRRGGRPAPRRSGKGEQPGPAGAFPKKV